MYAEQNEKSSMSIIFAHSIQSYLRAMLRDKKRIK